MKLSCLIIDDEPNAVNLLELLVGQATDWQVLAKCYNGLAALQVLKSQRVDFVFLDINMPQLSGIELAALLPPEIKIVFTTAYAEYAAESYTFSAIDYLLKPITLKRFLSAQQKIESYFGQLGPEAAVNNEQVPDDHFFVKSGRSLQKVLLQDILYFEGEKEYVNLVTCSRQVLIYRRLKDVDEQLKYPFIRVHNSYIINMKKIDRFEDNHITIAGNKIPVSDKYRAVFMDLLSGRIF